MEVPIMAKKSARKQNRKKGKKPSLIARITAAAACITAVFTAAHFFIPTDTPLLKQLFPHLSDTIAFHWNSLDLASVIYSDKSKITIQDDLSDNSCYCGVELDVQYNNYSKKHRTINAFTVTATNISVDDSPVLEFSCTSEFSELAAIDSIMNNGWSSTGELVFELTGIRPNQQADAEIVSVSLRDSAPTSWTYPALEPGERRIFTFTQLGDLEIEYHQSDFSQLLYFLEYTVRNQDNSFSDTFGLLLYISPDSVYFENGCQGAGDYTFYVIEVDTAAPSWTRTFQIQQPLPADTTVSLPIFIMPNRSCTMDLEVTFETEDGEVLKSDVLERAYFEVPYHQIWINYASGEFIDWNNSSEDRFVYFPYQISDQYSPNTRSAIFDYTS